ncbi:hypothetical protein NMG60_11029299 [Bertholletia excelsa]
MTALYKVHLHCPKCGNDIRKPLLRTPGVQSVDVKFEKGEIMVRGSIDQKKIQKRIEKLSKRKVEILPVPALGKDTTGTKITVRKTTVKTYMHCSQCQHELRRRLLKHPGIHNVTPDFKAQTVTIEGSIESEKLITYMKKIVRKHAEIIPPKQEKKVVEEKKEKVTVEVKSGGGSEKIEEFKKEKVEVKTGGGSEKIEEFKKEKVEVKTADSKTPYFIHYVYAPQLFSDENPDACSIM